MTTRNDTLSKLKNQHFDVVIIGGGINGAGACRDLALQGLKVALLEKGDFAGGTSSASSKLAHGGIRYLQQGHIKLVRQSCHERERLMRNAPHLVKPLPFLYPLYNQDKLKPWMLNVGLWLYDKLSGKLKINAYKMLDKEDVEKIEPNLDTSDLKACGLYYDAQMDDSRLVIENIIASHALGAVPCNYIKCTKIESLTQLSTVTCEDVFTKESISLSAKVILNTTGPWSDEFLSATRPNYKPRLQPSRGSHLIVDAFLASHAVVLKSKSDNRIFFTIPWQSKTLIGTTDSEEKRTADNSAITEDEISYLLDQTNAYFPRLNLTQKDIVSSFSGIRPLVKQETASLAAISREETYDWHGNMLTLRGGKYTTYRLICEKLSKKICKRLNHPFKSKTQYLALPGGEFKSVSHLQDNLSKAYPNCDLAILNAVISRYGALSIDVLECAKNSENGFTPLMGTTHILGEINYSVRHEYVQTSEDFLRRRTTIQLESPSDEIEKVVAQRLEQIFSAE